VSEHEEKLPEDFLTADMPAANETPAAKKTDENRVDEHTAAELIKLREEKEQLFSRLQYLQADFDNFRKRTKTERQEWTTQAVCDLMRELLPVIDNLERAIAAQGSPAALSQGIDLVYEQFLDILQKQGLSVIIACGSEFDPNCHHAIMQMECDLPENTVVAELQKGYKLGERVLRPSMVNVAK